VLHGKRNKDISDARVIWIARAFIVTIVALTYLLAQLARNANVFDLAVWCFSGFASLTPLVFAALYWKGATRLGAYASVLAAMSVWLVLFRQSGWGGEYLVGGVMPVTWSFAAGAVAMVLVSLVTPRPSAKTVEKFFPTQVR
jgi:SSS family solute:Na+ symporter